jgi:hypothetical protein
VRKSRNLAAESLIRRYEHNYFRGLVVSTKRGGQRWVKYISDKPDGAAAALKRAREYKRLLVEQLPWPAKVKRTYVLNRTGVVGVSRIKERTRSGKWFIRYVAVWPTRQGRSKKASFSVALYGEAQARRRAVQARRRGLEELLRPAATGPSRGVRGRRTSGRS